MSTSVKPAPCPAPEPGTPTTPSPLAARAWVHVVTAGLAMVCTLPGRTHGLGVVTETLLRDLQLDRVEYGTINLLATLAGALCCLPCGWLIDRLGSRVVLAGVTACLGAVVVVMSRVTAAWLPLEFTTPWGGGATHFALGLFLLVLLTRGLGQSALSVVSLALVGKSVPRHAGLAYGVYSFVVAVGFMGAFTACKATLEAGWGWRDLWAGLGVALLGFAAVSLFLVRPVSASPAAADGHPASEAGPGATLSAALLSPTFWVFGLGTSLYGLISSGLSLFNQSILAERQFDRGVFLTVTAATPLVGLASNLATGWVASRWPLGRVLAVALLALGAALAAFPQVTALWHVYAYAGVMGVVGGMITVVFFAVWGRAFGKAHLGQIQGVAQLMTVVASAFGPLLLAASKDHWGSYTPLFYLFAPVVVGLGGVAWFTPGTAPGRWP